MPIVVITAKDLSAEDHERLNGYVARVLQKGALSRETLLGEVRDLVDRVGPPRPPPPPHRGRPALMAKILLVEDNEMNRDMLSRRLAKRATRWWSRWTARRASTRRGRSAPPSS